MTDELSSKAFRLMALAMGVLPDISKLDLQHMTQQQLEKRAHKLELLGLIVLTNHVRPDSRQTVTELQDKCVAPALPCWCIHVLLHLHTSSRTPEKR